MDKFTLVTGNKNIYLSGKSWSIYEVEILDDRMICTCEKDNSIVVAIPYQEFRSAEFGIDSGNLWLQCELKKGPLVFCSPRKS